MEADLLATVFERAQLIERDKGEVIISGEDKPSGVFYIERGFIKVYSISRSGSHKVHIIYKQGEIFPLIWAIQGTLRSVFYEALTDVRLRRMDRPEFLKLVQQDPKFAFSVTQKLAGSFQIYADRLDNLEYSSANQRVIYRLVTLSRRFGRKSGDGLLIEAPITHQLLADSINLTRETVSRELEILEGQGFLAYRNHHFYIPNHAKLLEELHKFA